MAVAAGLLWHGVERGSVATSLQPTLRCAVCIPAVNPLCFYWSRGPASCHQCSVQKSRLKCNCSRIHFLLCKKKKKQGNKQPPNCPHGAGARSEPSRGESAVAPNGTKPSASGPCTALEWCSRPGVAQTLGEGHAVQAGTWAGCSFCSLSPPCCLSRQNRLSRSHLGRVLGAFPPPPAPVTWWCLA